MATMKDVARLVGYRQAMARAGLPIIDGYEVVSDFEFCGGLVAMKQRLNNPEAEPQVLPLIPELIERGSVSLR